MVRGLGERPGSNNLPAHHPTCQDHPLLRRPETLVGGIHLQERSDTPLFHMTLELRPEQKKKACDETVPWEVLYFFLSGEVLN